MSPNKKPNKASRYLVFAGMGFELLAIALASIFFGPLVDKYFNLKGLGTPIILFLLFFGWLVHFIHLLQKFRKDMDFEDKGGV